MRKVSIIIFIMVCVIGCISPGGRHTADCKGKISAVFLIEASDCNDLAMMRAWLDSCHIKKGILVLCDIYKWSDNVTLAALLDTKKYHLDTIMYQSPVLKPDTNSNNGNVSLKSFNLQAKFPHDMTHARLTSNQWAVAGVDEVITTRDGQKTNVLFLNDRPPLYFKGLMSNRHFIAATKALGFDSVICRRNILQGGDIIDAGDHIFLGFVSLNAFLKNKDTVAAIEAIRQLYGFTKKQTIDFILSPDSSLYHLDLYITHTGKNREGKEQFFIGDIDGKVFAQAQVGGPRAKTALQQIYLQFDSVLKLRYGMEGYQLDRVPVFLNLYIISALNGITDCVDGVPTYYFPYPVGGYDTSEPDSARVKMVLDKAYNIMSQKIRIKKVGVNLEYLKFTDYGAGQSLHCTMSVIRR